VAGARGRRGAEAGRPVYGRAKATVCASLRFQLLGLVQSPAKIVGYLSRNA
jgi:hypothetical protein